jgi:hypothetical protein
MNWRTRSDTSLVDELAAETPIMSTLQDLAGAAAEAKREHPLTYASHLPPRIPRGSADAQPAAAVDPSAQGPFAWGFRAAIGAAIPLFLVIMFAVYAAMMMTKNEIQGEIRDRMEQQLWQNRAAPVR